MAIFQTGWSRTQPAPLHGNYWLLPVLAVVFWTATLLGLLLWWIIDDHHKEYMIDETTVVFISDVGAAHKALFIPGTALTWLFYGGTLVVERWLRHLRRIPGPLKRRETIYDIVAVVFAIIGGAALFFLSVFDAFNHATAHWILTAVFVVCVALSAAFQTAEVMMLERDHVERKHLRRNAIWKLCIVCVAIAGAICFGGTYGATSSKYCPSDVAPTAHCNLIGSVAAVFEWFIAFLYDAYLFTLVLDLWPARKTTGHVLTEKLMADDRGRAGGLPGEPGVDSTRSSLSHPQMAHVHDNASVMREV